ncbi:hypothetical protein ACWEK5_43665 [Rhodococcus koreensis]
MTTTVQGIWLPSLYDFWDVDGMWSTRAWGANHGEGRSITGAAMRPANVAATIAAMAPSELVTIQAGMATRK